MDSHTEIENKLKTTEFTKNPFDLLNVISKICITNEKVGRELVIRALDQRKNLRDEYKAILDELAIQVGLYPYIEFLEGLSTRSAIRHASHHADGEMREFVIHSAQARILRRLINGESIILSAPTSFGKSLLIDLTIAAKNFENIVLIVPTLALVEETRRRMSRFLNRYSVITTNHQKPSQRNIFVLTQERYLSMRSEISQVDFFVIDEFYKLSISQEGDRATRLNQAFLYLLESQAQFYLLGPSISEIPEIVRDKTKCNFLIEDFQTVAIEIHLESKTPTKLEAMANILDRIDGQTMIYCSSPQSTRSLIKEYLAIRQIPLTKDVEILEAAKWTADNYHDLWLVSVALQHGIGIHHGRLPRALGRFMIRAFEEKKLSLLLCTSTLIEGVNTTAKNIIIFDNTISNKKKLDFFTFNNIKGRSGRMFQHFIGHVYIFDTPPQLELPFVDIPALNPTESTPSSLLISMPFSEIPDYLKPKVLKLINQSDLPIDLLKKLSGIEPEFLIKASKYLFSLDATELIKFSWSDLPTFSDIYLTSDVIWEHMGGKYPARQSSIRSAKHMGFLIIDLYKVKSVSSFRKKVIQDQIGKNISPDDAVENVLAFLRGWASFNYPKYLIALSDIANFVLGKRGLKGCNYYSFAMLIEHLFQPSTFSHLEELGLPTEISEKLVKGKIFRKDDELDAVIQSLRASKVRNFGQGVFEKRIIEDFQQGITSQMVLTQI